MATSRPELVQAFTRLAGRADGLFQTQSQLCEWLTCVLVQRLHGPVGAPRAGCDEVCAAACAVRFKGACPHACTPSEFDRVSRRLSTDQLEALLTLERGAPADPFDLRPTP